MPENFFGQQTLFGAVPLRSGNLWRLVGSYTLMVMVLLRLRILVFICTSCRFRKFGQAESAWLTTVPWILVHLTTMVGGLLVD